MKNSGLLFISLLFSFWANAQNNEEPKPSSQKEIVLEQKIKVFPNPATNVVNILGLSNSDRAEIIISDMYGNAVLKHRWEIRNNALNISIPTLTAGIYIISIRSKEQHVQTKFYKK